MCLQSFLLENLALVLSLFLPSRWQASIFSPEIFTSIWRRILQTVDSSWSWATEEGMPTFSTHCQRGCCALFQHYHSTVLSCLTKASFSFLTALIYDSIFLKVRCITLIYLVRVFIILMVCSWAFKKILMSCVLFKGAIISQYQLQPYHQRKCYRFEKNIKLESTFSHQSSDKNASALNQSVTWNVD